MNRAMMSSRYARYLPLLSSALLLCGACSSGAVYKEEAFSKDSPFQKTFAQSEQHVCEAAQKALLSQGYRVERAETATVRAHKDFQPDSEVNVTIDFDVTCKPSGSGAIAFANAVETNYKLKKVSGGASLNVAGAGGIALPWSKSADSLVKVSGATISDEKFYKRFFELMSNYLGK